MSKRERWLFLVASVIIALLVGWIVFATTPGNKQFQVGVLILAFYFTIRPLWKLTRPTYDKCVDQTENAEVPLSVYKALSDGGFMGWDMVSEEVFSELYRVWILIQIVFYSIPSFAVMRFATDPAFKLYPILTYLAYALAVVHIFVLIQTVMRGVHISENLHDYERARRYQFDRISTDFYQYILMVTGTYFLVLFAQITELLNKISVMFGN